nr:hypothetical protein Iba_chr04fCG12730 [Ipomoea batatas]
MEKEGNLQTLGLGEVIKKVRHGPASLVVARLVVRQWSQVSTPDASDAQIGVINNGVSLNLTSVSSASMRSQEDQEVEGNRTIASPTGRVLMDCALTFADMPIVLSGNVMLNTENTKLITANNFDANGNANSNSANGNVSASVNINANNPGRRGTDRANALRGNAYGGRSQWGVGEW